MAALFPFDARSLPERFLMARPLVTRFAITRDRIAGETKKKLEALTSL